jgi:putative effector of murein hydrolase LrgA (UPF0299 family)
MVAMIPTLLVVGLALGRWWRVVIPASVVGWVVVLLATDVGSGPAFMLGAAAFAAVNVTVGVLVNVGVRSLARRGAA